jgi:hypothetical protein
MTFRYPQGQRIPARDSAGFPAAYPTFRPYSDETFLGRCYVSACLRDAQLAANIVDREEAVQQRLGTAVAISAKRDTVQDRSL